MQPTDDWEKAEQRAALWLKAEKRAAFGDKSCQRLLDLRARVEALEQRAAAPDPAPAPDDRPLWEVMHEEWRSTGSLASEAKGYAAEIDAVADWLEDRGYLRGWELLRAEAKRTREGA